MPVSRSAGVRTPSVARSNAQLRNAALNVARHVNPRLGAYNRTSAALRRSMIPNMPTKTSLVTLLVSEFDLDDFTDVFRDLFFGMHEHKPAFEAKMRKYARDPDMTYRKFLSGLTFTELMDYMYRSRDRSSTNLWPPPNAQNTWPSLTGNANMKRSPRRESIIDVILGMSTYWLVIPEMMRNMGPAGRLFKRDPDCSFRMFLQQRLPYQVLFAIMQNIVITSDIGNMSTFVPVV